MDSFYALAIILYLLFVMYAANQADIGGTPGKFMTRILMQGIIAFTILFAPFTLLLMSLGTPPEAEFQAVDPGSGILVAALAVICGVIGYNTMQSETFQTWLGTRLKGYRPDSLVHQTAVLHCLLFVVYTIFNFVILGGLEGVAESLEQTEITPISIVFEGTLWVVAALLGVGFAIRRTWSQTAERLGLIIPTGEHISAGIMSGIGMFILLLIFQGIWLTISPQTIADQTVAAEAMTSAIISIPMALLISTGAAIGEEIIMRGALQPVFGGWLVSGFFVVLHSQYLFTPIMLFIFVLGMTLAWLRLRYGTITAIIAHFVYNALPFILILFQSGGLP